MDLTLPRQVRVLGIGLILLVVVLYAKTVTVIGTITRNNNTPVVNVLVSLAGQYRYTDVGGRYRIDGVPVGRQKLTVSSGGKVLLEVGVNIRDQMSVFNLKLP
jgi:Carboxypeptidase regulatory-like domain